MHGGKQEQGKRGGTENVAAVYAMYRALKQSRESYAAERKRITHNRDKLQ